MKWFDVLYIWAFTSVVQIFMTIIGVPYSHLQNYRSYKSKTNRLAVLLYHSIWGAAVLSQSNRDVMDLLIGGVFWFCGLSLVVWARRVNPYFVPELIVPEKIVTAGPYKYIKHPGYVGFALMAVGVFQGIGSVWCFPFVALYLLLLLDRTKIENDLLHEERT